MRTADRAGLIEIVAGVLALVAIGWTLSGLWATRDGLIIAHHDVAGTPVSVFQPAGVGPPGPVVVIAHGFAGSRQLMEPFAATFARNGIRAVTFDSLGHARNPKPLTGSITEVEGATMALMREVAAVAAFARTLPGADGRVVLLGHSMASDIVVRAAIEDRAVVATIGVSLFSPMVTERDPANLLIIVGSWETGLVAEALRIAALSAGPGGAEAGRTYGDFAQGTARRVAIAEGVEHVSVLYSPQSMRAALDWVVAATGVKVTEPAVLDARGPLILGLLAGLVLAGRVLVRHLPVAAAQPLGAGLAWRALWPVVVGPMLLTPLILRVVPTHFLPVLVADYLAVHFGVYGLLTAMGLAVIRRRSGGAVPDFAVSGAMAGGSVLVIAYATGLFGLALDQFAISFAPAPHRLTLILAMLVGTLPYFLTDEWLTRGPGHRRLAYPATKLAFLVSLSIAVMLDFERLFFLIIIVPVIVIFFGVYGLVSHWVYRRTQHPFVGAIANAVAFAVALGVTFPLLGG